MAGPNPTPPSPIQLPGWQRWLLFGLAFGLTATFAIQFCGLLFGCGCGPLWAQAATHCNIHQHGAKHCPWCVQGGWGFVVSMVPVFTTQAWTAFTRRPFGLFLRAALSLLAVPVVGGILGALVATYQGYWN